MTYCIGIRLNAGLVFLSDSRTNAGIDQISTFRKMIVYEKPDDRFMVLLSAGNLSISQSVREILQLEQIDRGPDLPALTIWNAESMFDAARVLGSAVRRVYQQDGASLKAAGIDFNASMIFGGQIKGEAMRMFMVYSAGNFIEASTETPYFQIGETKYGKPIIDRVITPASTLVEAEKCLLVSFDSTMRSNVSVGLPIDMLVMETDALRVRLQQRILETDPYYRLIHTEWGEGLKRVFSQLPDPQWELSGSPAPQYQSQIFK